jgi:2-amino-4-hydroxy-6-hydroxymethyldihydropteridine diphosphokinase
VTRDGYLGLGSNQGDRLTALRSACEALQANTEIEVTGSTSVYESAPQGEVLDQPDFLNSCLAIRTTLEPESLLDACKVVERKLGRALGGIRHGPRPIDVDVLLLGELEVAGPRLTLPHREISTRRFVVEPLLELAPDLRLPCGDAVVNLVAAVADQPLRRLGPL